MYLSDSRSPQDCSDCDERQRKNKNCHNKKELKTEISTGRKEWLSISSDIPHVVKILDTKFYTCPLSVITRKTWKLLELVNDTTDPETNIVTLPYPGAYLAQPSWYRVAVRIIRTERAKYRKEKARK